MYMPSMTTIRISFETKEVLDGLKLHPKESYEGVIERLASMVMDDEPLSVAEIADMQASLDDIRNGRVKTLKSMRKELGV
jgi:hypothetical protein